MTDLRDRLAVLCGYRKLTCKAGVSWGERSINSSRVMAHPFPANDLNALAAAWPEGWKWYKRPAGWYGEAGSASVYYGPDTGDEYADRLRLTVAVLETIARGSK